jgi:RNA polymerase sigma-70 factor (ECF subfamily)
MVMTSVSGREQASVASLSLMALPGADKGSERAILRAARKGSPEALESLVRIHWPGARRVAAVILADDSAAEDIAQEALLAAIRTLDRFDPRRPFRPWLYRIVANRALDWSKAKRRRVEQSLGDVASATPNELAPREISDELMAALKALSPEERAVVVLRHLAGFNSREIAAMLDHRPATVRSMLSRALARLRAELEETPSPDRGRRSSSG